MKLYDKFPTVDAGVSFYTGLCCAYWELGMKEDAMEIATEGLRRFPDEDPILYHNRTKGECRKKERVGCG